MTSRFLISNDMNKAVSEVAGTFGAGIRLKYFQAQGYSFEQSKEMIEPIKCELRSLFNPNETYGDFFLPGFLALVLQQTLLIGFAETIARERKSNSFHELYKVSGKSITAIILGKGLFYLFLFCSYALFFYTAVFKIFRLGVSGDALALSLLTVLFISSVISICFLIASFFKEKIMALQIFAFTSIPIFLVSGYPWPFKAMPPFMVTIAQAIPSTPYLNAMQRIALMGAGFNDVIPEILQLFVLLLLSITVLWFRI
jgi:ABC-2 type transport system permease protein